MNVRTDFESWYRQHHGSVLAALSIFCAGDHALAEDVTNDAWVEALENWSSVVEMASPVGWVTKVAMNKAKRSWWRRKRHLELLNSERLAHIWEDSYEDGDLARELSKLPHRQRRALVLRYIDDLTQVEVAKEMGVATGTAAATLTQARSRLRTNGWNRNQETTTDANR